MSYPRIQNGSELDTYNTYTSETTPFVGQKMVIEDGRTFRFVEAAGTALINGRTTQSSVPLAGAIDEAVDTMAAGVRTLTGVVSTGINPAKDLFKGGYVHVLTPAQLGPIMRIKSNPLFASNTGSLVLFNDLPVAIAAGDKVTYVESPFRDVFLTPTTATGPVVGIVVVAVSANEYGWIATGGPARVLTQGTIVIGYGVMPSDGTTGAVEDWVPDADAGSGAMSQPLGVVMLVKADGEKSPIFLRLEA